MAMNNTILITGASSGIGKACAEKLANTGHQLILTARRADRLNTLAEELRAKGSKVYTSVLDVRDRAACEAFVNEIPAEFRKIRVLINNAGLAVGRGPIQDGLTDDWNRMIDTNVKGLLYVSRAVAPILIHNGSGHIVNIGSIAGKEVYPGGNVYCASKHAVDALSKAMRIDLISKNIKVTNIAPGAAETEFSLVRFKGDEQTAKDVYNGFDPLVASDIAETIYFVVTRPAHVNINDLTIMPSAQASSTVFHKD
jgi:NADP-dependent 3-hydroxy acid dehydrogenase YdfG